MDGLFWVRAGVAGACVLAGAAAADVPVYTVDQLRNAGIAAFVGRTLVLRATLVWDTLDVKVPENPTPDAALRKQAGPPAVSFDTPAFSDCSGRKRISIVGAAIRKTRDAEGREQYSVGDTPIENGRLYTVTATLRLRAGFKPEMLANPAFVTQCNDPRYWAQTFELEIAAVTP